MKIINGFFMPGTKEYKEDFARENSRSLLFLLTAGMAVSAAAFVLQLITGFHFNAFGRAPEYMVFFGASLAIYFSNLKEIRNSGTFPLYIWIALLLSYELLMTAADDGEYPEFMFMFMIMFLPLLVIDAAGRVMTFTLSFGIAFAIVDRLTRPDRLFYADLIHLIMALIAVLYMSRRLIRDRVRFLEHSASAETRAEHDPLTGIYNRRGGETMIRNFIEAGVSGAFIMIDIDDFKHVNDTYGHSRGDEVLEKVAGTLTGNFRESDVVMRMGGDEFAVYAAGMSNIQAAQAKLSALKEAVHEIMPDERKHGHITVSAGCMINRGSYPDIESLSQAADRLLYSVKASGKDDFKISDADYKPDK